MCMHMLNAEGCLFSPSPHPKCPETYAQGNEVTSDLHLQLII